MERVIARVETGALARPSRAQLGYCSGRSVFPWKEFFESSPSAFSSMSFSATREKPFREDKSAGPRIDPAYFMNFGVGLFFFAIALNPSRLRLYHRP